MKREIEPLLLQYINLKLFGNEKAIKAFKEKDARELFIEACKSLWGVREATGHNDGTMVEMMQRTLGENAQEPWCMAFIQSCIAAVEAILKVESPVEPSEHCGQVWAKTPKQMRVKKIPAPGAIVIWQYEGGSSGHCGCVLDLSGLQNFVTIEGNTEGGQDPEGKIIREGGGVYFANRSFNPKGKMKLLGFLKPF